MGKTLRRCDSSRWICLTWKVITRYGFHFFFRWFLNYKFPSSRTRLSWSSPTQRVDDWRHRRGYDRTNQYLRWVGRKSGSTFIAQNNLWLAGRLLWMFGIFWMAPARARKAVPKSIRPSRRLLRSLCQPIFGAPAALVGSLFTIERNRSGRLCFALFGLSRPITISRAQKDSRRVGDNFGVVLLCFTNLVWQIWKGFRTVRYLILGGFVLFFWRLLDSLRFDLDK